jgi:hypothetical protein
MIAKIGALDKYGRGKLLQNPGGRYKMRKYEFPRRKEDTPHGTHLFGTFA